MRILYVTNYYPPHYIGGYELHCAAAAEWLVANGHEVCVLTGDYRRDNVQEEALPTGLQVHRSLALRYWKDVTETAYWNREFKDVRTFRELLAEFNPDIVVLWNMVKLASGIILEAQRSTPILVYHLMDEWLANFRQSNGLPQYWSRPARSTWGSILKPFFRGVYRTLLTPDLEDWQPENAVLVSHALGELVNHAGIRFSNAHVSYITYDSKLFEGISARTKSPDGALRFFWAGRLCAGKGLNTTLRALDMLWEMQPEGWRLDFCGPIEEEEMETLLRPRLESAPWKDRVRYLGSLPHRFMPAQYLEHDIFLFTSEVHEGMPGTIVESFAAGMPVIGTLTGGSKDLLISGSNCLTYDMGNAHQLALAMRQLLNEPELRQRICSETVLFAKDQCSPEKVFPRLLDFYERLLIKAGRMEAPKNQHPRERNI
jgi:glycogen synthase